MFTYTPNQAFVSGYLCARNFVIEETGGGCIAYFRYRKDGSFDCLTDESLGFLDFDSDITFGFYESEEAWDNCQVLVLFKGTFRELQTHMGN